MKNFIFKNFVSIVLSMFCLNGNANAIGKAYVFGFDIERMTGIPEHQIEEYGCLYKISGLKFISLLKSETSPAKYIKLDIRAKVIFNNKVYFIDRFGVVRSDTKFFSIDTTKFMLLLIGKGKCPRR